MHALSLASVALLAGSAAAKVCVNMTIPVTVTARLGVFGNVALPHTNLDVTTFIQNQTQQGGNFTATALTGYTTTNGTYNISASYCTPTNVTSNITTIQILTHGIGFDKTYWDLPYNAYNYSYVNNALGRGYATFAYDRLGIGNSSHVDPLVLQTQLEVAALAQMTRMIRNGSMPGIKAYSKTVHVGHSFGSAQSYEMAAMYPTLTDGLVLTGFSMNSSFVGYFAAGSGFEQANLNQPLRFGNLSASALMSFTQMYGLTDLFAVPSGVQSINYTDGYLTNSNAGNQQYLFFGGKNSFDTGAVYFAEATKQPVTISEILTLGSVPMINTFAGPVLVLTGDLDLPYCGGNCSLTGTNQTSIPAAVSKNFANSTSFTTYIQPNTGHGLNFHYNSTGTYNVIGSWLSSHKLAA